MNIECFQSIYVFNEYTSAVIAENLVNSFIVSLLAIDELL